jgi:hypothetical protein
MPPAKKNNTVADSVFKIYFAQKSKAIISAILLYFTDYR